MNRKNSGKPWNDKEDDQLVAYACGTEDMAGYVAAHDLGRTEQEGRQRYRHLCQTRPDWVAKIEAEENS